MANSSEWLGALGALAEAPDAGRAAPGWLTLLGAEAGDFRERLPFAALAEPAPLPPAPEPAPDPVPVPEAEDALALAYADGLAAGRALAEAEAAETAARQRSLRLAFRSLDAAAREVLAGDLADTVAALCEGVLGDYAADRTALLARCRAAAQRIGGAAGTLRLHLHPADIEALAPDALAGWTVIADSALEAGGLLLEGAEGAVRDGPADWRRAILAAVRG